MQIKLAVGPTWYVRCPSVRIWRPGVGSMTWYDTCEWRGGSERKREQREVMNVRWRCVGPEAGTWIEVACFALAALPGCPM